MVEYEWNGSKWLEMGGITENGKKWLDMPGNG